MDFKLSILRAEAKRYSYSNEKTRLRFLVLIELCKRSGQNLRALREVDYEAVGARYRFSGRSVQRWLKSYLNQGPRGLVSKKACGRKSTPIRGHAVRLIYDYVKKYQWGSELIHIHLKLDHGIVIGEYRIRCYLRKKGFLKTRRAKKKNKHTRKVVVPIPGAHTQMDVKYFPRQSTGEKQIYVYNFRDHATRWTYKYAYDSLGAWETVDFFKQVIKHFPGKIWSVQTDNGGEFTNFYLSHVDAPKAHALDLLCKEHGIRHRLIPPGEKELQGLVERSHREDEQELYHRIRPRSASELNTYLEPHTEWVNQARRKRALGWKTSAQKWEEYLASPELYQHELAILARKLQPWSKTQNHDSQKPTKPTT